MTHIGTVKSNELCESIACKALPLSVDVAAVAVAVAIALAAAVATVTRDGGG